MIRLVKYRWSDEDKRIVQVTEKIYGVGTLIVHVGLIDDLVEIIDTDFSESTTTVLPFDEQRLLQMARDWERRQQPYKPMNLSAGGLHVYTLYKCDYMERYMESVFHRCPRRIPSCQYINTHKLLGTVLRSWSRKRRQISVRG